MTLLKELQHVCILLFARVSEIPASLAAAYTYHTTVNFSRHNLHSTLVNMVPQ